MFLTNSQRRRKRLVLTWPGHEEITILKQGLYVRCAVTGEPIPLDELRYWNVDLQEAYRGPEEATQRWKDLHAGKP